MTLKLSSHTRLMNLIINLSIKNRICEPILYNNNNYELESIPKNLDLKHPPS